MAPRKRRQEAPAAPGKGLLKYFSVLNASADEGKKTVPSVSVKSQEEPQNDGSGPRIGAGEEDKKVSEPFEANGGLSEYERKRLARVALNSQFLQQLGVKTAQAALTKAAPSRPRLPKRKREDKMQELLGSRRSARLRGKIESSLDLASVDEEPSYLDNKEDLVFGDSDVVKYVCARSQSGDENPVYLQERHGGESLVGFCESNEPGSLLVDPSLKKVYTMSFSPFAENGLLALGGHQGRVSIFPSSVQSGGHTQTNPLMSFRAHQGWVSGVSLARSTRGHKNLLVTTANDGVLKLWDLNQSQTQDPDIPRELLVKSDLHTHGIFGFDMSGDDIATCSKDSSVLLSRFTESGLNLHPVQRYDDHSGVVKCVQFSPIRSWCIASGGNDRAIRVFDSRDAKPSASLVIDDAHTRVINSVTWHPCNDHLIMSASFDPDVRLFDLRNASVPVTVLKGPVSGRSSSTQSIFHPHFIESGELVVSTGTGGDECILSLYHTLTGRVISRGQLPAAASTCAKDPFTSRIVISMGQQTRFYDCQWQ